MGVQVSCLRGLRRSRALSQRALAQQCGLSVSTICKLEQGKAVASIRVIRHLAAGLNVPIADLLQDDLTRDEPPLTARR